MSLRDILFGDDSEKENEINKEAERRGAEAAAKYAASTDEKEADSGEIVTTDMLIGQIISKHPSAARFFMDCGMECIYCPASQMESLEEACAVHGIDADEICAELNAQLEEYRK